MEDTLKKAIRERHIISFEYEGRSRIVCPTKIGTLHNNNYAIEGYQIGGYSKTGRPPQWRLYTVNGIRNIKVGNGFNSVGREYKRTDKRFDSIEERI
jgi:hypothetical protein